MGKCPGIFANRNIHPLPCASGRPAQPKAQEHQRPWRLFPRILERIRGLGQLAACRIVLGSVLLRNGPGIAHERIGQDAGKADRLGRSQFGSMAAEIFIGSSLDSEYSFAHLGHIQVNLHDPPLAPEGLDQHRVIRLHALPEPTSGAEGEAVLGHLLRNRAASADLLPLGPVLEPHLPDLVESEAFMLHEPAVFGSHHRPDHHRCNLIQPDPYLSVPVAFLTGIFDAAPEHERSPPHRRNPVEQHPHKAERQKPRRQIDEYEPQKSLSPFHA